jgi:hypothetical protein
MDDLASALFAEVEPEPRPMVTLLDFDPEAEDKLVAAMLYPHTHLPEDQLLERVRRFSPAEKLDVVRAYAGERLNRRHRPGRGLERVDYRFDVLSDYGAFRDLQRHRMLTIEWQSLTPRHGYTVPEAVVEAGGGERFEASLERSKDLHDVLAERFPQQASYAVALAFRVRYVMQMNAREAMHLIELRSGEQGHPAYRRAAQQMHRAIAEVAGHRAIAEAMSFVDHGSTDLERLESERRAERRRSEKSAIR